MRALRSKSAPDLQASLEGPSSEVCAGSSSAKNRERRAGPPRQHERARAGEKRGRRIGNAGTNLNARDGTFVVNAPNPVLSFTDGASNTLLVGERPPPRPTPTVSRRGHRIPTRRFLSVQQSDHHREFHPASVCDKWSVYRPGSRVQRTCGNAHESAANSITSTLKMAIQERRRTRRPALLRHAVHRRPGTRRRPP